MTTARSSQICLEATPWYHCTTRCVRRAFLCGLDALTNRNFDHRKQWIEDRLLKVSSVFCIHIGAYAVMDNHYHVALKVDTQWAKSLPDLDVISRWNQLYKVGDAAKKKLNGETLSDDEQILLTQQIAKWRKELCSISRFMAEINQYIARRANKEDDVKGRFWEARFHSQAILDDDALLRTLIYIDLNPFRAGMVQEACAADQTSIKKRLDGEGSTLVPFRDTSHTQKLPFQNDTSLPATQEEYIALLEWTALSLKDTSIGKPESPLCFTKLGYSENQWLRSQKAKTHWHQKALGSVSSVKKFCSLLDRKWIWRSPEHAIH